jgi:hypothetical protein
MDLNIPHALSDRERLEHHEMEIRDLRSLVTKLVENLELVTIAMLKQDELMELQDKSMDMLLKKLNITV